MTKTKAQLRREAVERLKAIPPLSVKLAIVINALCGHDMSWKTIQDVSNELIDLLTDDETNVIDSETNGIASQSPLVDEPPEGDAVAIMRKVATCGECTGYTMRKEVGGIDWADALLILAGMIERDYVRRDSLADENGAQISDQRECHETGESETDVKMDSQYASNDGMEQESGVSEIVRNGDSYNLDTESDAVNGKDCDFLQDSREKLEDDVNDFYALHDNVLYGIHFFDAVFGWLDRQAAITTQECTDVYVSGCEACRRAQKREIAELQEKVDDLTVYNEASDDELFRCSYCHCKVYNIDMTEGDCGWGFTFCPQCGGEVHESDSRKIEAELEERDTASWKANYMHMKKQRDELQEKVDVLEAELNRTCSLAYDGKWLTCSNCGESLQWFGVRTVYKAGTQERALGVDGVRFCPFCGARIEDGESE